MKKITIVTPVFNGEKYIEATIKSVINQSYKNFEHIVIDGGSTDAKQLTRVFRGCKVKEFSMTADTDAAVRLSVGFDAALCYTDTGRLEGAAATAKGCPPPAGASCAGS